MELEPQNETCFLCQNVAHYKCAKCKKTVFCSPEHGRLHIRDDLSECFPYTVDEEGIVASRDIRQGEVVMVDTPMMVGPWGQMSGDSSVPCILCRAPVELDTCDTCHGCGYPVCGTCAASPDPGHAEECPLLAIMATLTDDYSVIIIARLLLLKFQNPRIFRTIVNSRETKDPRCSIVSGEVRESLMRAVQQRLNNYWSLQEVMSAMQIVEIRTRVLRPGIIGLYESESLLDSGPGSCDQCHNCSVVFRDTIMLLLATKDVKCGHRLVVSNRAKGEVNCIGCCESVEP